MECFLTQDSQKNFSECINLVFSLLLDSNGVLYEDTTSCLY